MRDRLASLLLIDPHTEALAQIENQVGPLDNIFWCMFQAPQAEDVTALHWIPELETVRAGGVVQNALNVFHCRSCGRLYGAYGIT